MNLHFGCSKLFPGPLEGWENLDIKPADSRIKQCDVTKGLPYPDNSIEVIYSCHTFEHFTKREAQFVISECFRVLKKEGVIKIVVPDLDDIIEVFYNFENSQDRFKFGKKFQTKEEFILFALSQVGQHKYMYSERSLKKLLSSSGFKVIEQSEKNAQSPFEVFRNIPDFPNKSLEMTGIKQ